MTARVPDQALVLCAGEGRRLRPLTERLPKPLVPFLGAPLLEHALRRLAAAGVRRVALNAHHRGEVMARWAARRPVPGLELQVLHEAELLGTGGGVARLAAHVDRGPLLVLAGDIVADFDLADLARRHHATGAEASMGLTAAADPAVFGPVGVDSDGLLVDIVRTLRRPAARELVNASVHLLEPGFVRRLRPEPSCLVRQAYLPALAEGARVAGWLHHGAWAETGTPAGLLDAQAAALRGELPVDPVLFARAGRRLGAAALVHPSARVGAGAQLSDGTVVGPRARVAADSRLRRCFVEADANVRGDHEGALLLADADTPRSPPRPHPTMADRPAHDLEARS